MGGSDPASADCPFLSHGERIIALLDSHGNSFDYSGCAARVTVRE
jgi:hypothetical protein